VTQLAASNPIQMLAATPVGYHDLLKTGPGTLAGRYLRSYWQPVSRSADLAVSEAKSIRLMGEEFTLYRGETGTPFTVEGRCAHRGAKLAIGWVEGDSLRCAYHAWKFDPTGQCSEQPAEPRPFADKVRIRSYPTREYLGLIFAYLGEGQPPAFQTTPEYEADGVLRETLVMSWPCNYFAQIENTLDYSHTAFLHWQFKYTVPDRIVARETEYGLTTFAPGLSGLAGTYETGHMQMPNVQEFMAVPPRGEKTGFFSRSWRVPIDDASFIRFDIRVVPLRGNEAEDYRVRQVQRAASAPAEPLEAMGERILRGELTFKQLKERADVTGSYLTMVQDYAALVGLEPMAEREHREQLGAMDAGIALMRKVWARELASFAGGAKPREWRRPPFLWAAAQEQTQ
jgi:5,5'-dehydrodivanillate O-demethylase oxygenase subunit